MAIISSNTVKILDSAGKPANGRVYFEQSARFTAPEGLVTTTRGFGEVRNGVISSASGGPLVIPETPEGEVVWLTEAFTGSPDTVKYAVVVPAGAEVGYSDLQIVVAPTPGGGIPAWAQDVIAAVPAVEAAAAAAEQSAADAAATAEAVLEPGGARDEAVAAKDAAEAAAADAAAAQAAAEAVGDTNDAIVAPLIPDIGTATGAAIAESYASQPRTVTATLPAGEFGWLASDYGMTPKVTFGRDGTARGTVGITPEALFGRFSTALRAPGATYYVDVATGSDANAGTSWALAYKSIHKAIESVNTAAPAAGATVYVKAGVYAFGDSMNVAAASPGSGPLASTVVDIAFVAVGGKVVDKYTPTINTPTVDVTYTNTYRFAFATPYTSVTAQVVVDKTYVDEFGNYRRYRMAPDAATCNSTPGSFYGGTSINSVLVNPYPGVQMLPGVVEVYSTTSRVVRAINFYMGGQTGTDSWELLGGNANNLILSPSALMTTAKVAVLSRVTGKYAGRNAADSNSFGAQPDWRGLLACFDCVGVAPDRDAFNIHVGTSSLHSRLVTVNCRSFDTGQAPPIGSTVTSRNGWTLHETAQGVDVAGEYRYSRGGTVHNINDSKAYMLGTLSADDLGDTDAGGTIPPTQFKANHSAQIWLERCLASGDLSSLGYDAAASSAIHLIQPAPSPLLASGNVA